jgi:RimJ/RimL family protein N-acetyltransferase
MTDTVNLARRRRGHAFALTPNHDGPHVTVPLELRTPRLLLRPWCTEDAAPLHPILAANWEHLGPWIPARVATPVPVPELVERLAGFAADFAAAREWRYGMFAPNGTDIVGEVGLYPRSPTARVPYSDADRVELGYWLRADATGQGFVTEAARSVLGIASRLPHLSLAEIRCDARNAPSAAVPKRLGFVLSETISHPARSPSTAPVELQVWIAPLSAFADNSSG